MQPTDSNVVRHPGIVRFALMSGIAIILNVLFFVLVAIVLPAPDHTAFCPSPSIPAPQNAATCDAQGGVWTENVPQPTVSGTPLQMSGYCDLYTACQQPYQRASNARALYAFAFVTVLGVLAIIIGLLPFGSSTVSSGLSYGGVLALIIGSASYWSTAGNWIRLIIAAAGLAALLLIGWKRFGD